MHRKRIIRAQPFQHRMRHAARAHIVFRVNLEETEIRFRLCYGGKMLWLEAEARFAWQCHGSLHR